MYLELLEPQEIEDHFEKLMRQPLIVPAVLPEV
jgi:hypothetical protein